ncbi:hypothetical protein A8O28_20810 [Enterobacteriaceae bacterium CCUG 67584]|nr:hypothetical protein [Enterobacteriaceae bacterium CCUG 67584]
MKPLHYVLLWIGEALLYTLVLAALFLLIPEMKAYSLVRMFTDVIPGDTWDKYYFLSLCILSLLIVAIIVYITASLKKR